MSYTLSRPHLALFVAVLLFLALLSPIVVFAAEAPTLRTGSNEGVEDFVRTYFADVPAMISVAYCESQFAQYNKDGSVLKNRHGSSATGVMQIMSSIHRMPATRLGYDIDTVPGNLAYARYLYETQGLAPWSASKYCWGGKAPAPIAQTIPPTATADTGLTEIHKQLTEVLETLNRIQGTSVGGVAIAN